MTLDQARTGSVVRILSIPDGVHRAQLIRLGLSEGTRVRCAQQFRRGPMVVQCCRQEIALGRRLAQRIEVQEEAT